MATREITLTLPENLAAEAEAQGMLKSEIIEQMLRDELRQRRLDKIFAAAERAEGSGSCLSEECLSNTSIPVTVGPGVAELVAELGVHAELERMIEHARQTIPCLRRLRLVFAPPYDTGPDPSIVIEAYRDPSARQPGDQAWDQYSRWKTETFSPDVFRHFTLLLMDESPHAG